MTDLTWLPAWRLAELIAGGQVTSVEVVEHFLARIEAIDPMLCSFAEVDADGALAQARAADATVGEGGTTIGPFHGVPIAVMDAIKAAGMRSEKWEVDRIPRDGIPVERMRAAGAVILGTTVTYLFGPDNRPRNPWNLALDPGNSSRGSASALAAGLIPLTLGMDGAGSTRLPAAWCGVLGLHPSRGLIPHVDYDAPSLLLTMTIGPMARDARDLALATQVLAGPDGRDFVCSQQPVPDYQAAVGRGVEGMRLAWTDDFGWSRIHAVDETERVIRHGRDAAQVFAALGAEVSTTAERWEDPVPAMGVLGRVFAPMGYVPPTSMRGHAERQAELDRALGLPEQSRAWASFVDDGEPTAAEYEAASESRQRNWAATVRVLEDHDLLLSVTAPMLPRTFAEWGLAGRDFTMTTYSAHTALFNLIGFPALSVPCGFVDGLPIGMQIVGRPGGEDAIFRAAAAFLAARPINEIPEIASWTSSAG
ncbi:amidase [Nocardioides sp. LHD-245]|uniref:amidase n=1 Tax=Nocardioides sp. LHD-245 TaxID=3051387 RepID=UPI0027E15956|nr:amidase [Nocardioides sp. LHD-245]